MEMHDTVSMLNFNPAYRGILNHYFIPVANFIIKLWF